MGFRKVLLPFLIFISLVGNFSVGGTYWVKYGWTSFEESGDARSIALGNALSAAPDHINSSFINPAAGFNNSPLRVSYAHHSRFAGMINSDFLSFPYNSVIGIPVVLHLINERIDGIPDTRNMLLDWGLDGEPGTNDLGEGNGILDEGERLDADKLRSFSQNQWGLQLSSSVKYGSIRVGLALKGLFHSLGDDYGSGIGFNLGANRNLWRGSKVSFVIHDFTSSWLIWENGTIERFRPKIISGFSQHIAYKKIPVQFTILGDLIINPTERSLTDDWQLGNSGVSYRLGFETIYKSRIRIQFGRNQVGFLSTGLGVLWKSAGIQYAFQTKPDLSLGQSHFISFILDPDLVWKWFK